MKIYYNKNGMYKEIDKTGKEIIYKNLDDIPNYEDEITEVEIEEGTTIIKKNAFFNCQALKKVTMSDGITEISSCAFMYNTALKTINIPKSVRKIGEEAFYYCNSLKEIELPKNLTEINEGAFNECKALKAINIPKNITQINKLTFEYCLALKNVFFEGEIPKISYNAFDFCDSLDKIVKNKIFYKIAQDIGWYNIPRFLNIYGKKYDSELIQELMTINIFFFSMANPIDREVFVDAALDSINNIKQENNITKIETDICNILITDENYHLCLNKDESKIMPIKENSLQQKINDIIKKYKEKEGLER